MAKTAKKGIKKLGMKAISMLIAVSMLLTTVYVPSYAQESETEAEYEVAPVEEEEENTDIGEESEEDEESKEAEEDEETAEEPETDDATVTEYSDNIDADASKKAKLSVTTDIKRNLISGFGFEEQPFVFRNDGTEPINGITVKSFVSNSGITLDGEDTIPHFCFRETDQWGFDVGSAKALYRENTLDIYLKPGEEITGRFYIPESAHAPYVAGTLINSTITFSGDNFEDCTTTVELNVYSPEKPTVSFGELKCLNAAAGYYVFDRELNKVDCGTVEIGENPASKKYGILNTSTIIDKYTGDYPDIEFRYEVTGPDSEVFKIYTGGSWGGKQHILEKGLFEFWLNVETQGLMPGVYNAYLHFEQILPLNVECNGKLTNGEIYIPVTVKVDGGNDFYRFTEAVTGLKAEAGNGYNYISWDAAGGADQIYYVERMSEDLGYYTRMDYDGIRGRTFVYDYDIENDVKVYYRACTKSRDDSGEGQGIWVWSDTVNSTPVKEGKNLLMPVNLDHAYNDYMVDGKKAAHLTWTLYDRFDNGDGKERYADTADGKIRWGDNSAVDYFYIVMDGRKLVDNKGELIKVGQSDYETQSEWKQINDDCAVWVDTYRWNYDVMINDNYAHSFYVVPVDMDGTDGIVEDQIEYNDFDNDNREPIPYPEEPVDEQVYKVIFDGNGGFAKTVFKNVKNGEPYGALANAWRNGYKLTGWFTAKTGGTQIMPEDIVNLTGDCTLYAQWVSISHKVTLNAMGGKVTPTSINVIDGETFSSLPVPVYAGHVFEGWYTEATAGTRVTEETTVDLTGDITLYAHWQTSYDIILDPAGGVMDAVNVKNVVTGKPYGELPVPTREGYTFMGWYLEKAGAEPVKITADTIVSEPKQHTLTAFWKGASYTVSFDGNGVGINEDDIEVSIGMPYGELPSPAKAGYTFEGWYTEAQGGVKITSTTKVTIAANHTLYAHWTKTPYKLIFDPCGGVVEPSEKTVYYDNTPFGELPVPIMAGCTFVGWYTAKEGGNKVTEASVLEAEADITVYARWEYKYAVSAPQADVEPGEIKAGTRVNLYSETIDAKIYYTVNCAFDKDVAKLWEDALVVNENVTIYAIAVKPGFEDSIIGIFTYTVTDDSADWGDVSEEDREGLDSPADIPEDIWAAGVRDVEYSGSAITFDNIHVYRGKVRLTEAKDYTVRYIKNTNAGRAEIAITGKGDYSGKYSMFFNIIPRNIGDGAVNSSRLLLSDVVVDYTGRVQKKTTYAAYNFAEDHEADRYVELKVGRDFKYVYDPEKNYKDIGSYRIDIVGVGNYTGNAFFTETIDSEIIVMSKLKVDPIPQQSAPAKGDEVKPDIIVRNGKDIVDPENYTVQYLNNTRPGIATVVITGVGEKYAGTKNVTFRIAALSIKRAVVSGLESMTYTGMGLKQTKYSMTYQVNRGEKAETLVEGQDYTVIYRNNINAGRKAAIVFKGMGKYDGELVKYFEIKPYVIEEGMVKLPGEKNKYAFQKNGTTPEPVVEIDGRVLVKNKDYTVKYANNRQVNDATGSRKPFATIAGKGNYSGSVIKEFVITTGDIANAKMEATDIVYAKKGGICKPQLTLTDTNGVKLAAGVDYDKTNIVYTYLYDTAVINGNTTVMRSGEAGGSKADVVDKGDIIPAGTVIKVTVHGIRNYEKSECSTTFRYVANDISRAKVVIAAKVYTGNDIVLTKDDIAITCNNTVLEKSDYEIVGYNRNKNSGTAQVIIKGIGNFGKTKTVNFKINKKPLPYVVAFDSNNAYMSEVKPFAAKAVGTMRELQLQSGAKLPACGFRRNGYILSGWNTSPDGSKTAYGDKEAFSIKDNRFAVLFFGHSIKLYAQWTPVEYTITYSGAEDGVNGVTNVNPKTYNVETEIILSQPTKEGYTFEGWYTDAGYRNKVNGFAQGTTGNKKLFAKWIKIQ